MNVLGLGFLTYLSRGLDDMFLTILPYYNIGVKKHRFWPFVLKSTSMIVLSK